MIRCSPLIALPFPLKTYGFIVFSFFPYQYKCVFCNRCSIFPPRYGPKGSSVNLPTHGLHQNMAFNCGRKPKETTRNTKELATAKVSSSWIISFFLWYPLIFLWCHLVSFGFLRFPLVWGCVDSMVFLWLPSFSFVFLWFPLEKQRKIKSKEKTNQSRKV